MEIYSLICIYACEMSTATRDSLCFESCHFLWGFFFSWSSAIFYSNINRLIHGLFHISLVISTRPWYWPRGTISVEGWWQGQYEKGHVLIYLSHILPGQITCYCPRKMLLPRRQITRRKLCFYYTCKFGVISIKYVINVCTYPYITQCNLM